jgi:precorrin-6A/cobalt-precorrin-6A reductase
VFPVSCGGTYHAVTRTLAAVARVLVLAGTTEATELAGRLTAEGHDVTSSLAGVTSHPVERPGAVRRGGFGGTDGLARYLIDEGVDQVVDATHPFAAVMPFHAAEAASSTGVAHCRLLRPPWTPRVGDHWHHTATLAAAAEALPTLRAERVFLALGRQSLRPFARSSGLWFLVRAIEPLDAVLPDAEVVLDRGPFDVDDEAALLTRHRVDTVVTKNSGGTAAEAKLIAAGRLGLRVVMVDRPPQPAVETVSTVDAAVAWCQARARSGTRPAPDDRGV